MGNTMTFAREGAEAHITDPANISRVKGVMFDIDGCLVLSDKPSGEHGSLLPGAVEAIRTLRDARIPLVVFTNGSARTPQAIASELQGLGLDVQEDEILTPSVAAAAVIQERHPGQQILAIGGAGVLEPLQEVTAEAVSIDSISHLDNHDISAVIIGWDTEFTQPKIQLAAEALRGGAVLYCTSDSPAFASHGRLNVGVSGFIATGLEHVSGVSYELVGKPSTSALELIARRLGIAPSEVLIVGDDLTLECSMARQGDALSILVTTGMTSRDQAESATGIYEPHWIIDSMYDFSTVIHPLIEAQEAP